MRKTRQMKRVLSGVALVAIAWAAGATLTRAHVIWTMRAPTADVARWAPTRDYAGARASATIGAGGGFNVLVGASMNSITLQLRGHEGRECSGPSRIDCPASQTVMARRANSELWR